MMGGPGTSRIYAKRLLGKRPPVTFFAFLEREQKQMSCKGLGNIPVRK